MLVSNGGMNWGDIYPDFSIKSAEHILDEKNTPDSQKLEIISELFVTKDIKLVKNEQENLILRRNLGKFSNELLKVLCQELKEIFKNVNATDKQRALVFEKFLDAEEREWPFLKEKLKGCIVQRISTSKR